MNGLRVLPSRDAFGGRTVQGSLGTGGLKGKTLLSPVSRWSRAARAARPHSATLWVAGGDALSAVSKGNPGKAAGQNWASSPALAMDEPWAKTEEPKLPVAPRWSIMGSCWRCWEQRGLGVCKGAAGALGSSNVKKKWGLFFPQKAICSETIMPWLPVSNFLVLYCNGICMKMGLKNILFFLG